jgi:nucleoside-diphosphate-sugar epimerase
MKDYAGASVLVTGGSGFIGSHLVRALVSQGAEVHAFVRPSSSIDRLADCIDKVRIHHGSVEDYDSVAHCITAASPRFIFHLAADMTTRHAGVAWDAVDRAIGRNLIGTLNIVRAAATLTTGVKSLIRTGSLAEYGTAPFPFVEHQRERPASAYSASLAATAQFCQALQAELDFQLVTLRLALVYGPGQSTAFFVPQFIESCLNGSQFDMTDGTQMRDLVYVDDIVRGFMMAGLTTGLRGELINLATGKEHTLNDIAGIIARLVGTTPHISRGKERGGVSDLEHFVGSPDHAAGTLNWSPTVELEDGLRRTVEWQRRLHRA